MIRPVLADSSRMMRACPEKFAVIGPSFTAIFALIGSLSGGEVRLAPGRHCTTAAISAKEAQTASGAEATVKDRRISMFGWRPARPSTLSAEEVSPRAAT